ncbi:DGQHR domain-containing protein [bacterium]|nr:DGQHR domain-containing protein [bacterium]
MKIPAIKGKIGNWRYYSGIMSFEDICKVVTASISELYEAKSLSNALQRGLTDNYIAIKNYILHDNERFFNALVLAIYNGDPQWLEVGFKGDERDVTSMGFLEFSGGEEVFPVDGQHRVKGIEEALKENPDLRNEQVPVVFIAHSNTEKGIKRTRKLFSTINRRAKPVQTNENIALDEDDISSIITRELIESYPLFSGNNVVDVKGKQIPVKNEEAFMSLISMYMCIETLIKVKKKKDGIGTTKYNREYKLFRPDEKEISEIREYVKSIMDSFVQNTEIIKRYIKMDNPNKAKTFRNSKGGDLLFRPIAQPEYFSSALKVKEKNQKKSFSEIFAKMDKMPRDISKAPWLGLLWNEGGIISRTPKTIIHDLIVFMTDCNSLSEKEKVKLINGYARCLNIPIEQAKEILNSFAGTL